MRRFWSILVASVFAASLAPSAVTAAQDQPSRTLVRESFIDYPRGHPQFGAKPPNAGHGKSSCGLPASDLCTDFKDGRFRWASLPVSYYVNTTDAPAGVVNAVRAAFSTWQDETKSDEVGAVYGADASAITYTYEGSSHVAGAALDDHNVVSFADLSSCSGCLAVTTYWYWLGTRTLAEFDITFNTAYPWSTTARAGTYDVRNVATHEAGHTLVLGDLYTAQDAALTMYGYADEGETTKDTLGAGDVLGVRKAYPSGQ